MPAVDYFTRVDVATLGTTYTATATCLFGVVEAVDAPMQLVVNEGQGAPASVIAVSFDGQTDHAYLTATGITQYREWNLHPRNRLWLRRLVAAGAGQFVQVAAWS